MKPELLAAFATIVGPPDDPLPLVPAALAYSACLQDGNSWPDAVATLAQLEREAVRVCTAIADPRQQPRHVAEAVLAFMTERGFRGPGTLPEPEFEPEAGAEPAPEEHYEDPRNSLLDRVLERRIGLPICLSVLAVHLGERCGVPLEPIGFPGHFLCGLDLDADEPLLLDAFHGRLLGMDDIAALYARIADREVDPDEPQLRAHLAPTHPRLVLTRMLQNLRRHHMVRGSRERASDVVELMAIVHPELPSLRTLHESETRLRELLH